MNEIFVDTDILIDYSKGYSQLLRNLLLDQEKGEVELFINPIVIAEFLTDRALVHEAKLRKAEEFLAFFSLKEITKQIGIVAGELLRKGMVDYLGDSMIAATCVVHKLHLATRNAKHFRKVHQIQFH